MQLIILQNALTVCKRKRGGRYAVRISCEKTQRSDGEAFIQLISQYELTLYRTAKRLGLNDNYIADLLQDTILTAFEKIGTLKGAKYFNTGICRILLNNCYRFMGLHQRTVHLEVEGLQKLLHQDDIPLELDDALMLYYVNGLTTKVISEFLYEPEETIKSRISRAKQYLKKNYYVEGAQLL